MEMNEVTEAINAILPRYFVRYPNGIERAPTIDELLEFAEGYETSSLNVITPEHYKIIKRYIECTKK